MNSIIEHFLVIMNIQEILKEKFELCYVLNLSDRKDRRDNMEYQFKQMGMDDIETSVWLRYHYTTKFPYNDLIANAFNKSQRGRFTKANEIIISDIRIFIQYVSILVSSPVVRVEPTIIFAPNPLMAIIQP